MRIGLKLTIRVASVLRRAFVGSIEDVAELLAHEVVVTERLSVIAKAHCARLGKRAQC